MKLLPIALACCAVAAPAAAQEAEWGRYGDPVVGIVYRDATGCTERSASEARPALAVREDVSGLISLTASDEAWHYADGTAYDVRLVSVSDYGPIVHPHMAVQAHGFRDASGRSGLAFPISEAQIADLGYRIELHLGRDPAPLAVFSNPGNRTFLHRCAIELSRVDHGSGKPAATHAALLNRGTLITNDDYPSGALRAEEQGITTVQLSVSAKGLVMACDIVESSGSSVLDNTSCNLFSRRARFTPARDGEGQPTEDSFRNRLRWEIPYDKTPKAPPTP